jgi:U4/U6.U5 tri-snRNP component SNU23
MNKKNEKKLDNKKPKLKTYIDDKGRKRYDVSSIYKPPVPEDKSRKAVPIAPEERTFLKPHNESLDLDDLKGKTISINKQTGTVNNVFYCKVCECPLTDNAAYVEHIAGKSHNRMLGMNMRVEKVGIDKVREKLLGLKRHLNKK